MLGISEVCSFQIQVEQGSKKIQSKTIAVTGSNQIEYSFSQESLAIQKGGSTQQIVIQLTEPLPFKAEIPFEFFNKDGATIPFVELSQTGTFNAETSTTQLVLDFAITNSSSFSGTG